MDKAPTVIVLASGRGLRFRAAGGTRHKLQALLCGVPVLQRTLDAVRSAGLPLHVEQQDHPGMGHALAAAVAATPGAYGWLVLPADMPLVRPETLRSVARALVTGAVAAQPTLHGERGHPVGFARSQRDRLLALSGDEGARSVLRALRSQGLVSELPTDDAGILEDIDTPQDLQRAEALWAERLSA